MGQLKATVKQGFELLNKIGECTEKTPAHKPVWDQVQHKPVWDQVLHKPGWDKLYLKTI